MGLINYISRQPNQKAKSISQYDEKFMVATISRIRDAITSFFCHPHKIPSHKRHATSTQKLQVNKTRVHSCELAKSNTHISNTSNNLFNTRATVNNYNSKIISAFNCHANHLLQNNTAPAAQIQSQNLNCNSTANPDRKTHHIIMSTNESPQNSPTSSPQTPRVKFRTHSTPIATKSTSQNNNQASSSPENHDIELSREDIFENNLNQLFTKSYLAVLTSKDAVLKEIRDCVKTMRPDVRKSVHMSIPSGKISM